MSIARSSYLKNTTGGDFVDQKQGGTILGQSADTNTTKSLTLKDSSKQTADAGQRQSGKARKIISGGEFGRMRRNKFLVFGQADELAGVASQAISRLGRPSGRSDAKTTELSSSYFGLSHLRTQPIKFDEDWDNIYLFYVGTYHPPFDRPPFSILGDKNLSYDVLIEFEEGNQQSFNSFTSSYLAYREFPYSSGGWKIVKVKGEIPSYLHFQVPNFLDGSNNAYWDKSGIVKIFKAKPVDINARLYFNQGWKMELLPKITLSTTDISSCFSNCTNMNDPQLVDLDVSNVTNMIGLFSGAEKFNQPIGGWDVSNVTSMYAMFDGASAFNQDIEGWDVSNVTSFRWFMRDTPFNKPLNSWDVSSVTTFERAFYGSKFNQPLNNWDTSSVQYFSNMFEKSEFNNDISGWTISGNAGSMFSESKFNHPSINQVSVSGNAATGLFYNAKEFNQPLNNWNTASLTSLQGTFNGAEKFNNDISTWNVANVTNTKQTFAYASAFNQDISGWNTANVTNMEAMFNNALAFNQDVSNWNVSRVTNFNSMFNNTPFNQDVSGWNVGAVQTSVSGMFNKASSFNQDISGWNWRNVYREIFSGLAINFGLSGVLLDTNMSTENYDLLLQSLATHAGQGLMATASLGTLFDSSATYTAGGAAEAARNTLVNTYGWIITDGGAA